MADVRFGLLGPMELAVGERRLGFGPAKQAAVLGALLVDAGTVLSPSALIDRVWGEDPPVRARETLHSHIARIRALLKSAGAATMTVNRRSGGYVLEADRSRIDLHEFRRILDSARAEPGSPQDRIALLRKALALWRGEPLDGIAGVWADQVRAGLRQQRLGGYALWSRLQLEAGRPDEVIEELSEMVAEDPLVESLVAWLMRALCLAGRTAEALGCYAQTRRHLARELGAEPGAELRRLHETILRGEVPQIRPSEPPAPVPVPHQLPADVSAFTGRGAELARLNALVETATRATAAVVAISGTAGVGKTALAVHWAHLVSRDQFPDGQLYADLHGHDAEQPVDPAEVLGRFLIAVGGPRQYLPAGLEERAAAFRTLVAQRRLLIVLDNASGADQVRPLLPGSGASVALVTSRDSLAGLVARDGAHRLDLELLDACDARELLRRLVGPRVDAEPEAAATLAAQCVQLPLALRVAAELAAARRGTALADLVAELSDLRLRLDRLDAHGDSRTAVTAVFSWSMQHLSAEAMRAFRLLGLHPGADFDPFAAAALIDAGVEQAHRLLDQLARAHLVHPALHGRYGMHDLLRAYANTLNPAQEAREAATRLIDYYLASCTAAVDRSFPAGAQSRPLPPTPGTPVPAFTDAAAATAWLDRELPTLTAIAAYTAAGGWAGHAVRLSRILNRYLAGGRYLDALTIHAHARQAAALTGDQGAEAHALLGLGTAHGQLSQFAHAAECLRLAAKLFRQAGNPSGQARALTNLGIVEEQLGNHKGAFENFDEALALFRAGGDDHGRAGTLNNIGIAEARLGRYGSAAEHLRQALLLGRRIGDKRTRGVTLNSLGYVHSELGDQKLALEYLEEALTLFRQIGDHRGRAYTLNNLGGVYRNLHMPRRATELHGQALSLFDEAHDRDGQVHAHNSLGEAARVRGRSSEALAHHSKALSIGSDIGARDQQGRAHHGLGDAYLALGDLAQARRHYERALDIYAEFNQPRAERVRASLAAMASGA